MKSVRPVPFTTTSEEERDRIIKEIMSAIPKKPDAIDQGRRIVVTGKGGVGKTAITSALAYMFSASGGKVLAVDEDPQMNLPYSLGLSLVESEGIVSLNRQLDYIEEKTGARPGTGWGLFITLNPEVEDVIERFGIRVSDNINLLVMGTVYQPAVGCVCPENDLLQAVIDYISLKRDEVILMDTEAGLEHFGRGIAKGFHHSVVVSEPTFNSMLVAKQALTLAKKLQIPHLHLILNKVRNQEELKKLGTQLDEIREELTDSISYLPYDESVYKSDPSILPLLKNGDSRFLESLGEFFGKIAKDL